MVHDTETIFEQDREYQKIKRLLQRRIGRQWAAGKRLPPIKTLAGQLGCGQNNTHRAIKDLVAAGLLVSRPGRGTYVAQGLSTPTDDRAPVQPLPLVGKRVAVLNVWKRPDQMHRDAMDQVLAVLQAQGVDAQVVDVRYQDPLPSARAYDAVVRINPSEAPVLVSEPGQAQMVIDTAAATPVLQPGHFDVVSFDSLHAGYLAGLHLAACGCRNVCFIGRGDPTQRCRYDVTSQLRLQGLEAGLGYELAADHLLRCRFYMSLDGARAVQDFLQLKPRPDGVCAASDELAVGFLHGAASHGLEPGRDFQLIGFDGQELGRTLPRGPLTTVAAPMDRMGRHAGELLVQRLLDPLRPPLRVVLSGELRQGTSTRLPE